MTDRNEAIQSILRRLAIQYADDPNIQTIGYGLRYRGGQLQMERAIIFYVRRKYASVRQIEAAGSKPVPPEIDGFPTDVQPFDVRAHAAGDRDDKEYDPLLGGVATSNADGHIYWFNESGTLGILVRDAGDGTPMVLSNWHVWADGGEEGDDIIQPGHPTAGDHVEAVTKVAACGPLITSLIEWEAPSPLTAGLYGGAAAASVAAAASDFRDPTRRGQDQTPTNAGELTTAESVQMTIEYPQLPLPGVPFKANVKWLYERQTDARLLTHEVEESRTNTQFLLGKMVVTDKQGYQPGETVRLTAAIWDYQPRPCDAYHVVAHLIPHARPNSALRVVLHPSTCPRTFPQQPPDRGEGEVVCVLFDDHEVGEYPYKGKFEWLGYLDTRQQPVRIVDWFEPVKALQLSQHPLVLTHAPASRVIAKVAQFTDTPVTIIARNAAGAVVDQKTAPQQQGVIHELTLNGEGIVEVVLRGGGGEGLLISYCIEPIRTEGFTTDVSASVAEGIRAENPELKIDGSRLKSRRCCFTGSIALPPDEKPGKWDVHLTVQNVNPVPEGTPPDQAAQTIGGHVLSSHTSAEVLGCTVVMLLDHVFDVF
jgi:hypothetical protein